MLLVVGNVYGDEMGKKNVYYVIMAGGDGTRLWPLSRQTKPKQLLPIGTDKSLLEQSIDRIAPLTSKEYIWISTTTQHEDSISQAVGNQVGTIIAEPGSRNTGPAILLCAMEIYAQDPQALIIFIPADAFIPQRDWKKWRDFLQHAVAYAAQEEKIVLLGIKPTYPATGYGYITYDTTNNNDAPYLVTHFREKPSLEVAERYIEQSNNLWNISIFCAQASLFLHEFQTYAPDMFNGVKAYCQKKAPYQSIVADSIDYAVMEHSKRVVVLPVDVSWCDVGNIEVFLSLKQQYNTLDANFIAYDAHNNLVDVPGKLVALVGVDNLCVVEVNDALLITTREDAENVRNIIKLLKQGNYTRHL